MYGNHYTCRVCEHTTSRQLSQTIIPKYLILYEIQCEMKIL